MSDQLSAVSLNRVQVLAEYQGQRKHRPEMCAFLGSPYGAPAHRKVPGERPEGGADRMSAPDLRGRMPRKISAGTRNRGCAGVFAPSGVSFFLVAFSWTSKKKLPPVGQPPTSNTPPAGRLDPTVEKRENKKSRGEPGFCTAYGERIYFGFLAAFLALAGALAAFLALAGLGLASLALTSALGAFAFSSLAAFFAALASTAAAFFAVLACALAARSSALASTVGADVPGAGRSTSCTSASGAASPWRKP